MKKSNRLDNANKSPIFVSIHIGMTDMVSHLESSFGLSPPPESYFTTVLMHFERKFGRNVVFVASSDNVSKAKRGLSIEKNKRLDIVFSNLTIKASTSLALLSLVQGLMITFGTFGLWGTFLRRNITEMIIPRAFLETDVWFYFSFFTFFCILKIYNVLR